MTIHYRDVKRKSDKKLEKKQDRRNQFRAVITDALGNQSGAGDIWFNRLQRKVWAMPNGGTQPFPYNCFRIKPAIGLGVIIGYSSPLNQLPEVLQTDTEFLGPSNTTGTAYEAPDNEDFLPGGRLQLWLDTRLIQSLAIYPNSTGLLVNVTNGDYVYQNERKTFNGQTSVDLSGSQPAGPNEHLYVGLYLDSSNALQTVDGATVATSATAPEPTWPAGSYRLGMVLLDDTQTSFSMADDIVNLKIPWTDEESFSSGAWPNAGEIKIGDTIYATLAAAQAVAVSPNVVKLGEGTYPASGLVFATGVSFASAGNATITQTSDANCMTLTNATIRDINFSVSINSANTRSALIFVGTCHAYNVRISGSNAGAGVVDGFAYADTDEIYLGDCQSIVDGDAVNINNANAIVTIANGTYEGGTGGIEIVAGKANLLFPHVPSDNVTAFSASRGIWFDSDAMSRHEGRDIWRDSSTTAPLRITERATAPSAPVTQDIYLADADTSRPGAAGLMRYNGSAFVGIGGDYGVLRVKNTSGATRAAGDVGYIVWTTGSGLEFKTTTAANDDRIGFVAVVIVGGADNATIKVAQVGRHTIPYAGSAPAAGDYLVFSTTAGKLSLQTTMSPDVCAVAMAAGSGGNVDAMLLPKTSPKSLTASFDIYRGDSVSTSDFVATINGAPSGANVTYNAPSSGAENCLVPTSTSQIAKMVLHNTTRGTNALISSVNTGTNVITLTATAPAAWASGDTITIRSQTNTAIPVAGQYYVDFELVSGVNDLARFINLYTFYYDSTSNAQTMILHPFQANVQAKEQPLTNLVAGQVSYITSMIPLYQKRFQISWKASGAATAIFGTRLQGEGVAVP